MELKGDARWHERSSRVCFNRTFMELKAKGFTDALHHDIKFQSHLYGIESGNQRIFPCMALKVSIAPLWNWKQRSPPACAALSGFNRTFMELKVTFRLTHLLRSYVSIAPLWNWKEVAALSLIDQHAFQSHLYGIERFHTGIVCKRCPVSIAPLWNWKPSRTYRGSSQFGFNRTFMELKEVVIQRLIKTLQVSIAPLWNWKYSPTA